MLYLGAGTFTCIVITIISPVQAQMLPHMNTHTHMCVQTNSHTGNSLRVHFAAIVYLLLCVERSGAINSTQIHRLSQQQQQQQQYTKKKWEIKENTLKRDVWVKKKERKWRRWRRYLIPSSTSTHRCGRLPTCRIVWTYFVSVFLCVWVSLWTITDSYHIDSHTCTRTHTRTHPPDPFGPHNKNLNGYKYYLVRHSLSSPLNSNDISRIHE